MSDDVGVTEHFSEAVEYARDKHKDQRRKSQGDDNWPSVPYVAHPMAVAALVLEHGGTEDQAIAALLHDVAEDHGGEAALTDIAEHFGSDVARMVRQCSDSLQAEGDEKEDWKRRKRSYVDSLGAKDRDALLVSCADKLHNARAILADHRRLGDSVYLRFRVSEGSAARGRQETLWYYNALSDRFVELFEGDDQAAHLAGELRRTVAELSARGPDPDDATGEVA